MKNLTATEKIDRAKVQVLRALEEIKNNPNRAEVLGFVTGQLAHTFATLDAQKDDSMAIVFVAAAIMDEVQPAKKKTYLNGPATGDQLPLKES